MDNLPQKFIKETCVTEAFMKPVENIPKKSIKLERHVLIAAALFSELCRSLVKAK